MKKFSFLLVSFLVLLLASCKNSFSDNSNTAYITISVDEERTVFPTFSVTAMTDLVLSGKHNGNTIVLGEFDTVNQLLNKKIPIETGTWDFSFSAVIGKSRFVSNIDSYNITIGNHSLIFHFDLIEEDIKTQEGKGTLDITLDLPAVNDINHVKAGLFSIDTDSVINGFELTSLQISNNAISYFKQNVPTGYYKFKAYFYADENETLLLDTYKEIVVVADSCTSKKTIAIENLNKVCTVTYNTNGAGEIAGQSFTKFSDDIVLPPVSREGYTFEGWYTESTFDNKVTTIPADSRKDFSLYASWGINVTPDTLASFASNSTLYNVVHYSGDLSDDNILAALCDSIPENTVLDLSKATGRTSMSYRSFLADPYSYISYFSSCKEVVLPECLKRIGTASFYNCSLLNHIIIPDSVTSIDFLSFRGCSSLQEITIPDSVTSIGSQAFLNCSSLQEITIPINVTSIESYAFDGCSSLQEITIPDSVTSIGSSAFFGCSSLQEITIPNGVTSIKRETFKNCNSLKEITIPNSVTSIEEYAFEDCSLLQKISIPNGVTSIGRQTFYRCSSLQEITIPNSVTSIGISAFSSCSSLQKITIPDSVTTINDATFSFCSSLQEITIPDSVTSIGSSAFFGCSSLTEITIPSSVIFIHSYALDNCSKLKTIHFVGTKSQWDTDWNSRFPSGAIVYCTDGNISL